jgi:translation elongation factor EF-G
VYGHSSANPESVATLFGGKHVSEADGSDDAAIFVINPNSGVDEQTIANWSALDDFQTPRLIVVTELESGEADFDDAVLLANRLFDQVVTPYLVLHDELGAPCALISLETQEIVDYSQVPEKTIPSDPEHKTLVSEFVEEYASHLAVMGEGAFAAGLLFPAIPLIINKRIGVEIVKKYLSEINR